MSASKEATTLPFQPEDDARFYGALGKAVQVLRAHRGQSRRELALAAGLSYTYLAEIENGRKRLSARALLYVARGLNVRPYEILSMAEAWAQEDRLPDVGSASPEPAELVDVHWMLSQLPSCDASLVSDLVERLYHSNPTRVPASVSGR